MIYQHYPVALLVLAYVVLAGNTAYPIFLRILIWIRVRLVSKFISTDTELYEYMVQMN